MPASPSDWLASLNHELESFAERGRLRALRTVNTLPNHHIEVDGKDYLNLASNDYLGFGCDLALHRQFAAQLAQEETLAHVGFTASASRLLGGEHPALAALESLLAESYGHARHALLFNSGYHANIGILPALTGRDDLVLSDRLIHASLVDGIRLCRARWSRYRHNDMDHLRSLLAKEGAQARRIFIVAESVYSMDGDTADLKTLVELKQQYGAVLYVDEAHAIGACGPGGLGLAVQEQVLDQVDVLVGTFGKALASSGAFAILAPATRQFLINTARSLIFTTAMPPVCARWSAHVVRQTLEADQQRTQLAALAQKFRQGLGLAGPGTHIVPLVVGEDAQAVKLAQQLRELGYWVPPIRPPTVPEGTARLRFSLGARMCPSSLETLVRDVVRLKEQL